MRRPTTGKLLILNLFVLFGLYLMQYESTSNAGQTSIQNGKDNAILEELNQGYLLAYSNGDANWFDEHLVDDFTETAQDSSILDKVGFLKKISAISGTTVSSTSATELTIRVLGNMAIVQAIPVRELTDGSVVTGGRYTDIYYKFDGVWLCVVAQLGGLPV